MGAHGDIGRQGLVTGLAGELLVVVLGAGLQVQRGAGREALRGSLVYGYYGRCTERKI